MEQTKVTDFPWTHHKTEFAGKPLPSNLKAQVNKGIVKISLPGVEGARAVNR